MHGLGGHANSACFVDAESPRLDRHLIEQILAHEWVAIEHLARFLERVGFNDDDGSYAFLFVVEEKDPRG